MADPVQFLQEGAVLEAPETGILNNPLFVNIMQAGGGHRENGSKENSAGDVLMTTGARNIFLDRQCSPTG
ncbi:MAG: hypothetical protein LBE06_09820 [Azoarcus sp.]|nr:hypothetical protein [Azoarcus sp.]